MYVPPAALSLASRPGISHATMSGMGDNVALFRLLGSAFPDEHITNCLDARVVAQNSTTLEDPEDPNRRLVTVGYVLTCPHVHSFEFSLHVTVERRPE